MKLEFNNRSEVVVSSFSDVINKGITVKEFERSIELINVKDPDTVAKAVERCNNRCKDNDVELELSVLRLNTGGDNDPTDHIKLAFKMS